MSDGEGPTESSHSVRFGTSSWAYEGWRGQIYHHEYAKARFSRDCLAEYAAYEMDSRPLFRTVGIDHSFYRPPSREQLRHYADLVPEDFRFCLKVWEELTIPVFAKLARYGAKGGTKNPRFLDVSLFQDLVATPALEALGAKFGVFLFEFQRTGTGTMEFLDALEVFLGQLPVGPEYAVEVRDPSILGPRYAEVLAAHHVAHVYNHWTAMPPLSIQHTQLQSRFTADSVVFRLLTPLGLPYRTAVARYRPYDRLVLAQPQMRSDTLSLIEEARVAGRSPYVLVNNRAEGNAPLTIQALVKELKR